MLEANNIYLGDCYELIKQIQDKSVDLVITDPPYLIKNGDGGGSFGSKHRDYHKEYTSLSTKEFKREGLRLAYNFQQLNKNIKNIACGFDYDLLNELDRVMKYIYIYIFCNKNQISTLMKHYEDKGCNVDLLVWCKTNPIPTANNKYLSDLEYCVFAREKGQKLYGSYNTKSKYYISSANVDDKKMYKHPTIKPTPLIKRLITNSTKENDLVLDCFAGSGTTLKACQELNRRYIGFEINEEYYKIAKDRLNNINAKGEVSLF